MILSRPRPDTAAKDCIKSSDGSPIAIAGREPVEGTGLPDATESIRRGLAAH